MGARTYYNISLAELLNNGVLKNGQKIFHFNRKRDLLCEGTILLNGKIKLDDGTIFNSLSGAAKYITNISVNGWRWWYTGKGGNKTTLYDLRDSFIESSE